MADPTPPPVPDPDAPASAGKPPSDDAPASAGKPPSDAAPASAGKPPADATPADAARADATPTNPAPGEAAPSPSPAPPALTPEQKARQVLEAHCVRVFRPSATRFDARQVELPDDFYQPSADELRHAAQSISADVHRLTNGTMMTRKMRDAHAAKRMSRFRKVLIRILFPDRMAIQGIFTPQSTVRNVQRFVRAALLDARNTRFHMFVVPPKMKLTNLDDTLWSQGFVPAALIHVAIDEGATDTGLLLKKWLLDKVEDTPESIAPVLPPKPQVLPEEKPVSTTPPKKEGVKRKIPKWLKTKK